MPNSSVNDYEIAFEVRPTFLLVRVILTKNDYDRARQYWMEVLRFVHKRRCDRVVVEVSAITPLPPADAQTLMCDFSRSVYPGIKIAIVNRQVRSAVRSVVETSSDMHGRSIRIFDDIPAAEMWLQEEGDNFAPATLSSPVQDLTNSDTFQ